MIMTILSWIIALGIATWIILFTMKMVLRRRKERQHIRLYRNVLKIEERFKHGFDIFFADAKQTFSRVVSIFSAVFWTWLEVMFLKFFFVFSFGLVGYILGDAGVALGSGSFEYSYNTILENTELMDLLVKAIVITIFVLRVPIHYKKEVKKRTSASGRPHCSVEDCDLCVHCLDELKAKFQSPKNPLKYPDSDFTKEIVRPKQLQGEQGESNE